MELVSFEAFSLPVQLRILILSGTVQEALVRIWYVSIGDKHISRADWINSDEAGCISGRIHRDNRP